MNSRGFAPILLLILGVIVAGIVLFSIKPIYEPNVKQTPIPSSITTQPSNDTVPESWNTFTNTSYNYQIKYPPGLFVYGIDNALYPKNCSEVANMRDIVVISEIDLDDCGFYTDTLPNPESIFTIYVDEAPVDIDIPFENTPKSELMLSGIKSARYDFNELSPRPNFFPSSRVYTNYAGKGYIIYSGELNTEGKTETFNQILSTFQFVEDISEGYSELINQAIEKGRVAIIVELNMDYVNEPDLNEDEIVTQRNKIKQLQNQLIEELHNTDTVFGSKYTVFPYFALTTNTDGLTTLINSKLVKSIHENIPVGF